MEPNLTTLNLWLTTARSAYADLVTGNKARVIVDQNGERVEYTATNATTLLAWIRRLEAAICDNKPLFSRPQAIGVVF